MIGTQMKKRIVIYGNDGAAVKAELNGFIAEGGGKYAMTCQKSSYFDGRVLECDAVSILCGTEAIAEAYRAAGIPVLQDAFSADDAPEEDPAEAAAPKRGRPRKKQSKMEPN